MRIPYVLLLILSFQSYSALSEDTQLEIPTEDAQKQSLALVRDVFKSDFAKTTPSDKRALAVKLLQQATETRDDTTSRYVLFREAEELAAQGGDATILLRTLSERSKQFKIDAVVEAERLLDVALRAPGAKDQYPAICAGFLDAIDEAVAKDRFDMAVRLAAKSESAARNAKDLPLLARAQSRVKETKELLAEFQKVRASIEKLATSPDHPESNLAVGRFQSFVKGNWSVGLPFLAKGSDKTLKELAEKELARAGEPAAQLKLADEWWDASEKLNGIAKEAGRKHAGEHYRRVLKDLSGLSRTKVEQRLEELNALANKPGTNLLQKVDLASAIRGTWKREGDAVVSDPKLGPILPLPFELGDEYDIRFTYSRTSGNGLPVIFLCKGGNRFVFEISDRSNCAGFQMLNGKSYTSNETKALLSKPMPNGQQYSVLIQIRNDFAAAYLDGALLSKTKVDYTQFSPHFGWSGVKFSPASTLAVGSWEASIIYHWVEAINVSARR